MQRNKGEERGRIWCYMEKQNKEKDKFGGIQYLENDLLTFSFLDWKFTKTIEI